MNKRVLILLLALSWAGILQIHAQGYHNHLPIGSGGIIDHRPASDGGSFLSTHNGTLPALTKLDGAGDELWSKAISDLGGMIPDQQGGVIVIVRTDGLPSVPDSSDARFLMVHLDANGDITESNRFSLSPSPGTFPGNWLEAYHWTTDGELLLLINVYTMEITLLLKLDANGQLLWHRTVWDIMESKFDLFTTSTGDVLVLTNPELHPPHVTRFTADGDFLWRKRLTQAAPNLMRNGEAFILDDNDNLMMAFTAESPAPGGGYTRWFITTKVDLDGNVLWSKAFRREPQAQMSAIYPGLRGPARNSRRLANGNYLFGTSLSIEADTAGNFVRDHMCTVPPDTSATGNIIYQLFYTEAPGGWLSFGKRRWTEPVFGNFVEAPLFGRAPLDLDAMCQWNCVESTTIIAEPPPPDIFTLSDIAFYQLPDTLMVEPWPTFTMDPWTLADVGDACTFPDLQLVGIDEAAMDQVPFVYPNPILAGDQLHLEYASAFMAEVIDVQGRLVTTVHAANGNIGVVATTGWSKGLYLVRLMATDGRMLGSARVVVH